MLTPEAWRLGVACQEAGDVPTVTRAERSTDLAELLRALRVTRTPVGAVYLCAVGLRGRAAVATSESDLPLPTWCATTDHRNDIRPDFRICSDALQVDCDLLANYTPHVAICPALGGVHQAVFSVQ